MIDLTTHPRPTLARAWRSLDGAWGFAVGAAGDDPLGLAYDHAILVPFPPESTASGLGLRSVDHPRYRRTFTAERRPGHRLLLHCEGVDHDARVWVNGRLVGAHVGGYTPFTCDVTDALTAAPDGATHELVIAATDVQSDREQPRGKQDWLDEPHEIWYRRSSGIWRTVWLEEVPEAHLTSIHWVTGVDHLRGTVTVSGARPGDRVEASVRHAGTPLATVDAVVDAATLTARLDLPLGPDALARLGWSPDLPRLLDVDLRLVRGDVVLDAAASYTGLRTVAARDGAIEINGRRTFLRLVLEQAYWPDTHFTAPSADAARAEADLIASLGFNGLRMHQVSGDPRLLRRCDEIGLLVWADVPAAGRFSARSAALTASLLEELVARDRNHPCVIAWVPFNESWGVDGLAADPLQRAVVADACARARALDPTRLALGNDGWEHVVGDVVGVHDYSHDARVLARRYGTPDAVAATLASVRPSQRALLVGERPAPGTPVVLSECGGVSLDSVRDAWKGYGRVRGARGLLRRVARLAASVGEGSGLAGFCWTQLTDTLQEQNGLCRADRTPKAPADLLAQAIRGGPA